MAQYTLVIGNKAYSSWSLRPWLVMKHAGLAFDEVRIPLYQDNFLAKIRQYSLSGSTYAVALSATAQRHSETLLALPAMREWYAAANAETKVLPQSEHLA